MKKKTQRCEKPEPEKDMMHSLVKSRDLYDGINPTSVTTTVVPVIVAKKWIGALLGGSPIKTRKNENVDETLSLSGLEYTLNAKVSDSIRNLEEPVLREKMLFNIDQTDKFLVRQNGEIVVCEFMYEVRVDIEHEIYEKQIKKLVSDEQSARQLADNVENSAKNGSLTCTYDNEKDGFKVSLHGLEVQSISAKTIVKNLFPFIPFIVISLLVAKYLSSILAALGAVVITLGVYLLCLSVLTYYCGRQEYVFESDNEAINVNKLRSDYDKEIKITVTPDVYKERIILNSDSMDSKWTLHKKDGVLSNRAISFLEKQDFDEIENERLHCVASRVKEEDGIWSDDRSWYLRRLEY